METKYQEFVVTKKFDRLDAIVFRTYGNLDFLEEILELNIKIIQQEVFLPQGTKLKLPIYEQQNTLNEVEASRLW